MKIKGIITRERLLILIVGVIVLFSGVVYRFYPVLIDLGAGNGLELEKRRLGKYYKISSALPGLEDRLVFLTAMTEKASHYLMKKESSDLAAAFIQELLSDFTKASDITIKSVTVKKSPSVKDKLMIPVPVQIVFSASIGELADLLIKIESAQKLLKVSELRITNHGKKKLNDLDIVMTIEGFIEKSKNKADKS
jgi:hypothetical protein